MTDIDAVDVLQRLAATAERLSYNSDWNPTQCGDSQMRIASDGRWFYQGSLIARPALVQLFSRLLRREGEQYFLVTPVEKLSIEVEDAPFVSINTSIQGEGTEQKLYVTTNLHDTLCVSAEHPLWVVVDPLTQEPAPYVSIGANLAVRVQRSDFYQLVDHAQERLMDGERVMAVFSAGEWFSLGRL
ncbi:DUF1285 domain-containing protein [Pseudomonas sp. C27(2019)]|uniref:DUF1285 domain-containing protein n=1 Tax=Pseudomonas sp. C27(2019) TaxID=2604941 RepID=UPI0012469010|nr:DUF1285 domain-containing protein [Pseudomonas sp. C27(2019)]QEY58558.1 DUF1285 domain-containing protein [Pseudomonas sp. C27(2019)]